MDDAGTIVDDLARIRGMLHTDPDVSTLDELAGLWLQLDTALSELSVLHRSLSQQIGSMLADVDYDPKDGYQLPDGQIISHYQPSVRERWQGRALLRNLATEMVEPETGEMIPAVPFTVLADIIPGVGSDDMTSSKWRTTGLKNLDVPIDDYRSREWDEPRVKKGPKR